MNDSFVAVEMSVSALSAVCILSGNGVSLTLIVLITHHSSLITHHSSIMIVMIWHVEDGGDIKYKYQVDSCCTSSSTTSVRVKSESDSKQLYEISSSW